MTAVRRPLATVLLLTCVVALAACGVAGEERRYRSSPADEPGGTGSEGWANADVRLAVVGDSITSPWGPLGTYEIDETMWLSHVLGRDVRLAGGWAVPGATTADMAANARPVEGVDVLVILAGTNDGARTPFEESADNLVTIVEQVGAPRVIVSSIPPRDDLPHVPSAYNERLRRFTQERGWEFVDATAGVRSGEQWRPAMTEDGIHPTVAGQREIGLALRAAVLGRGAAQQEDPGTGPGAGAG